MSTANPECPDLINRLQHLTARELEALRIASSLSQTACTAVVRRFMPCSTHARNGLNAAFKAASRRTVSPEYDGLRESDAARPLSKLT